MPQLATFHIGKELFALDILLTKEIGKMHEITKVPEAPEYIIGLMNLRGQILTIMDPRSFLEREASQDIEEQRLIILKTENELNSLERSGMKTGHTKAKDPLAIVIDQMRDILNVEEDQILPPPPNLSGIKRDFVSGVVQLKHQLVIILAIDRLVNMCVQFNENH